MIEQIKTYGQQNKENGVVIKFGVLQEKTDGLFEALLGTLLTARKYKVSKIHSIVLHCVCVCVLV